MRRRGLLGVAAILAAVLVGYIAYTANSGLPLQSFYRINVDVPDADRLIDTADVRIAGIRVGEVTGVTAEPGTTGRAPYARIAVAIAHSEGPLPVDSTARVRPASVLGLTYVDLVPGRSHRTLPAGATLPLTSARPSSDLTDLVRIFDRSSARNFRAVLRSGAYATAGRGPDINATIHAVSRLLGPLTDVASALAAPATRLPAFLRSYEQLASALAPVSTTFASLIRNAATTFDALASVRSELGRAIDAAPGAESAATAAFSAVRPALDGLSTLAGELKPAGRLLPATVARIDTTLTAGERPLMLLPPFAHRLGRTLGQLDTLSLDRNTNGSLRKLTDLGSATRGALSLLVPAQVYCNVISLFTAGFAGVFGTLGTGDGPSLGDLVLSETGAQGEQFQNGRPSANVGIDPIPIENRSQCQAGNEPWTGHQQLGNPTTPTSNTSRPTVPPPAVEALAQRAGLLAPPAGLR